jgi:hypothetical protein
MNNDDHGEHAEAMLRQVWNNHFGPGLSWDEARQVWFTSYSWDNAFAIDEGAITIVMRLPAAIVRSLHPMPAEMAATLDCWRDKMVAAVDEVVQRYKTVTAVDEKGNITFGEVELVQRAAASNDET